MTPIKIKRGTIKDKLESSKALFYEWMMLNESAAKIPIFKETDKIIYWALVESFCVHLRNFIEFFHRKDKQPFHIDYLPKGENISLKHRLDKIYGEKVNDLLSHCTYKRLNYTIDEQVWDIPQIRNQINENMLYLIGKADKSLFCKEILEYETLIKKKIILTTILYV